MSKPVATMPLGDTVARTTSDAAKRIGVAWRDDLRDPAHGGLDGDRVADVEAGDEHPQAEFSVRPSRAER